jgi:hypothetical protein
MPPTVATSVIALWRYLRAKINFMNKWLLRILRQVTKKRSPTLSAWLIRTIATKAKRARNFHEVGKRIRSWGKWTALGWRQKGKISEQTIRNFVKAVNQLAEIWTFVFTELWKASCQPGIQLWKWLKPSLHNNQLPERVDLVVKEVKCRLLEKYWPPQRQRCDFVPAPAI